MTLVRSFFARKMREKAKSCWKRVFGANVSPVNEGRMYRKPRPQKKTKKTNKQKKKTHIHTHKQKQNKKHTDPRGSIRGSVNTRASELWVWADQDPGSASLKTNISPDVSLGSRCACAIVFSVAFLPHFFFCLRCTSARSDLDPGRTYLQGFK